MKTGQLQSINPGKILESAGNIVNFTQAPPDGAMAGHIVSYETDTALVPGDLNYAAFNLSIISQVIVFQQDKDIIIQFCFEQDKDLLTEKGLIIGENFPYSAQLRMQAGYSIVNEKVIVTQTFPSLLYLILKKNDTPVLYINFSEEIRNNVIPQNIAPTIL